MISAKQASCYERLETSLVVMSVISLSEVAFKRFEVDSLVDSAQTWHVDAPRASGV